MYVVPKQSGQGHRKAFPLVALLVVVAIIATLVGLLLPAIQKARTSALRAVCQNNLHQIGIATLNFESAYKGLPRAGEHIIYNWTDPVTGTVFTNKNTQDLQSPFVMLLPFLDKEDLSSKYDMRYHYNQADATGANGEVVAALENKVVAQTVIPTFMCPVNALADFRNNGTDTAGYACTDYAPVPYVENALGGAPLAPTALTGAMYPPHFYKLYASSDPVVSQSKLIHLNITGTNFGEIDPMYGMSKIGDIRDGTSTCITFYEDVGRNEKMDGYNYATSPPTPIANEYYDPVTDGRKHHWRWADPDTASGLKRKINNTQGGSMFTIDPNVDPGDTTQCPNSTWTVHDCGPNNEAFSFHGRGAHVVFVDGHVVFLRDTVNYNVISALCTRSNGTNEIGFDYVE
jgi:prepilin-type processing-associated H-X9-DG protein